MLAKESLMSPVVRQRLPATGIQEANTHAQMLNVMGRPLWIKPSAMRR